MSILIPRQLALQISVTTTGSVEINDPAHPDQKKQAEVKSLWMSKTELQGDLFDVYAFRLDQRR